MVKRWNVTCPRQYKNAKGETKTRFWSVGTMFALKNREGFSLRLETRVLPVDELVCFPIEEQREDDDLPQEDPPF